MSRDELDTTADAPSALRERSEGTNDGDDVQHSQATKREGSERPQKAKQDYLSRGALLGRYVVLDIIGEGGMGVVYSAFDPDLDRRVAIKLLQASNNDESTGQQWLLREAQALARLSHPNVVSVHDVGTLANDRVFVAMELVDGQTLRKWLRKERTWREVVDVMLAAGTGLAAAHSAGLVHRDFKPENVLIGTDGRTRVMDFGLARLRPGENPPASRDSDLRVEARSPLSERLTIVGTIVGTPAYMAPEIYRGGTADARADQFAFGVALYETLFLTRPYERRDLQEGVAMRPKPPPSDSKVPAQIKRVIMRALSIPAAERYPSMDALLAELRIDPTVRRKRVFLGAGAAAAIAGAIAVTYAVQGSRVAESPAELCTGTDRRLAGVWDAAEKTRIRDAFVATKSPIATTSYQTLSQTLDKYAAEWTKTSTESCEATRIRGAQTEDVMSLRQACLDQRLEEMRALVRVLGDDPSTTLVEQGDRPALALEPLARCSNVAALLEPGRPAPEIAGKVFDVTKALAEAKAQIIAGRYVPGLIGATKAADQARTLGWKPSLSEALGIRGSALQASGRFVEAAAAYADATWAALEGKRDDLLAGGAFSSAMCVASGLGKPGEAKVWLALADSAARRAGWDRQMDLRRSQVRGIVFAESGDLVAAVAAHEQTYKIAVMLYGKENPALFADEVMYATTLLKGFKFKSAIPYFEHAMALRIAVVGKDHSDIAMMLSNAGIGYRRIRDSKRAHEALGRALAIREKTYGKNSPLLVATLDNLADLYEQDKNFPAALEMIQRAQRLAEILPGKDHPVWHQIATDHAEVLLAAGKLKEARVLFDEVLANEHKNSSVVLPVTQTSRAELALIEREWEDAVRFANQAIAGFEAAGGPTHPELVRALSALGRAKVALGKRDEAKKSLERALEIAKTTELHDDDLAATRDALRNLN